MDGLVAGGQCLHLAEPAPAVAYTGIAGTGGPEVLCRSMDLLCVDV